MELAIENQLHDKTRSFVLSGVGLTIACHFEHLFTASSVNLSRNLLRDLGSVYALQCVRELNVADNLLTNCRGLDRLQLLQYVDLRNNGKQSCISWFPYVIKIKCLLLNSDWVADYIAR